MQIANDTILITGGSAGIGRALAEAMHRDGAKVIITGRREDALRSVAEANPGMDWAVLDMTDADAIAAFATQVTRDHPALNAVIHNAGIMEVEDLTADAWDLDRVERTLETNLLGPIRLTAGLIAHLKQQPRATIMTVSSGLAFVPLAATPIYSATKAAIHSWTQALRSQLKDTAIEVLELAPPDAGPCPEPRLHAPRCLYRRGHGPDPLGQYPGRGDSGGACQTAPLCRTGRLSGGLRAPERRLIAAKSEGRP